MEALLAAVPVRVPFDPAEFCQRVAAWRGRPIRLKAVDTVAVGLPSGTFYEQDAADTILYDETTTFHHQCAIILHELWHLVAGHYSERTVGEDAAEFLLPLIGRGQLRRWAARDSYAATEEREAERFARRVLEIIGRRQGSALADRLGETFGE